MRMATHTTTTRRVHVLNRSVDGLGVQRAAISHSAELVKKNRTGKRAERSIAARACAPSSLAVTWLVLCSVSDAMVVVGFFI